MSRLHFFRALPGGGSGRVVPTSPPRSGKFTSQPFGLAPILLATLSCVLMGCPRPVVLKPVADDEKAELLARLFSQVPDDIALAGEARLSTQGAPGAVRVRLNVRLGMPDRFIAEIMGPAGTEGIVYCDGTAYGEWRIQEKVMYTAPADEVEAGALGMPFGPRAWPASLIGRFRKPEGALMQIVRVPAWDEIRFYDRDEQGWGFFHAFDGQGRPVALWAPDPDAPHHPDQGIAGVRYDDWRRLRHGETELWVPGRVRMWSRRRGGAAAATFEWIGDPTIGPAGSAAEFRPRLPRNVERKPLSER